MKIVSSFLLLFLLVFFVAGLSRIGDALIIPAGPSRLKIVVTDLVAMDGPLDRNASVIPQRLSDNFTLTGLFKILDKRASLEENLRAGVDAGSEPDYKAWSRIGADYLIKGGIKSEGSELTLELRLFDVAFGKQILGKRYSGGAKDARKMVNQFTNSALEAITGTPGVFGSEIIFASGSPSQKQIFKTTLGSDEAVQITNSKTKLSTQPTIGPGGAVAWVSRDKAKDKPWDLVRNGKVVSSGDLHLSPAFKPDGSLAAAKCGPQKTSIYDFSTKPPTLLVSAGGINVSPTFSPDGTQMAYASDQGGVTSFYIAPAIGGPGTRLTSGAKSTDPAWSPTGEYIAFVIRETDICIIRPDGTGFRQLTGGQGYNYRPSFSPDGRMIVFSSTRNGRSQLFVMSTTGNNPRPLMPEYRQPQEQPYWSPVWPEPLEDKK